jgi:hypothetical protein
MKAGIVRPTEVELAPAAIVLVAIPPKGTERRPTISRFLIAIESIEIDVLQEDPQQTNSFVEMVSSMTNYDVTKIRNRGKASADSVRFSTLTKDPVTRQ